MFSKKTLWRRICEFPNHVKWLRFDDGGGGGVVTHSPVGDLRLVRIRFPCSARRHKTLSCPFRLTPRNYHNWYRFPLRSKRIQLLYELPQLLILGFRLYSLTACWLEVPRIFWSSLILKEPIINYRQQVLHNTFKLLLCIFSRIA